MIGENELSVDKSRKLARFLEGVRALAEEHGDLRSIVISADDGETVETLRITKNIRALHDPTRTDLYATRRPKKEAPRTRPRERAKQWLVEQLRDGERPSGELFEQALAQQICCERTLQNAAAELGIKAIKEGGTHGRWFWALPGERQRA